MEQKTYTFRLREQTLQLHPYRAVYWEEEQTLLLADLHLGKTAHFRREGFAVPADTANTNWDKLIGLLLDFQPQRVVFLGDLFHSVYNQAWESFCALRQQFGGVQFELVKGNHDSLSDRHYAAAGLVVHEERLRMPPFLFIHEPLTEVPPAEGAYVLAGHLHPGVVLEGRGRQRLRLPCFLFGEEQGVLPAFGAFTGLATIAAKKGDRIFVLTDEAVIPV